MKKLYLVTLLILQLALATKTNAQNVGINATSSLPDNSAMLDVSSTDKGFLAPRLTTIQQNAISLPATGLLIFNTTDNVFKVNTGTPAVPLWTPLAMGSGLSGTGYPKFTGSVPTYITAIPNTDLANSAITIQGTSTPLGGTVNVINGTGFVKAAGTTISYDNNTYLTSATARTNISLTTTGTSGAATYNNSTGVLNVPVYPSSFSIAGASDATITTPSNGQILQYNFATGKWVNTTPSFLSSYTETDPIVKAINGMVKSNGTTISAAIAGTDYTTPSSTETVTNKNLTSGTNTFPTFNQNTTGTAANITGIVAVANGGTGLTSVTIGDLLYGSATNVYSKLPAGSNGQVLTLTGGIPSWVTNPGASAWSITGNNVTAGSQFLGSINNVSLRMRTNNVERMVVDSTGKVGIGIANPAQMLHIAGESDNSANGPLLIKSMAGQGSVGTSLTIDNTAATGGNKYSILSTGPSATGGAGQLGIYGGSGSAYVFRLNSNGQAIAGLNNSTYLGQLTASPYAATIPGIVVKGFTSQSANLQEWRDASSVVLAEVSASGKLGINQLTPTSLLHLGAGTATANTAPLKFTSGTNLSTPEDGAVEYNGSHFYGTIGTTRYQLDQQGAGTAWSLTGNTPTAGSHFLGSTNNVSLRFRTNNTERMIIDSTGKVGVGLTDPAAGYYLSVKDNLEIRRTATTAQMIFTNTAGSGNFRIGGDGGDIYWQGGGGQSLQMGSYWATVLGGDRQTAAFPAFIGGISGTSVIVGSQRDASVALGIQGNSASQTANLTEWRNSAGTVLAVVDKSGNVGIGVPTPTAALHLEAGTASPNTAPLKFTAGTNLTSPENGAVEFNGTHFYGTVGSTRYQLDQQAAGGTVTSASVVSANGFSGSVATSTTTPAITLGTTVTGILKGNGTAISAAVAADFPTLNQNTTGTSANVTGTVAVANGGTGVTTVTDGGILYGATATTIASTAAGTTGQVLQSAAAGIPVWVNGGTMMLSGNTNNSTETTVGGGQKNYFPIVGSLSTVPVADVSAGTRSVMSRAGTIRNLYVVLDGAPGGGKNITVTIYKGGTAQTLTVAINGNVTVNGSDTTNSFTVAAGDEVGIVISSSSTPSTHRRVSWSADFTY